MAVGVQRPGNLFSFQAVTDENISRNKTKAIPFPLKMSEPSLTSAKLICSVLSPLPANKHGDLWDCVGWGEEHEMCIFCLIRVEMLDELGNIISLVSVGHNPLASFCPYSPLSLPTSTRTCGNVEFWMENMKCVFFA